jgi:hypothetical protein
MSGGTSQDHDGGRARLRPAHRASRSPAVAMRPALKKYGVRLPVSGQEPPTMTVYELRRIARREAA